MQACAGVTPKDWGLAEKQKKPSDKAFTIAKVAKAKAEDEIPFKIIFPSERQSEHHGILMVSRLTNR